MQKSSLIEKAFLLKKTTLFAGVDLDLLLSLADKATMGTFEAQEPIFGACQEGSRLYVVADGRIALFCPEKTLLGEVKSPDFFGDEALFNDRPRGYSATALENSALLSITKMHLLSFMNECPSALINLMQIWANGTLYRDRT
ncbi:MAG: cyclic nucleotide-binding domain-containing protein [Chlamydiota bacterium]